MTASSFDDNENFQRGLRVRRRVLGDEHVERSVNKALEDPLLLQP